MDWIHPEVGLKTACWLCAEIYFGSLRSKSVEKLPHFPPAGLEPLPHATAAQYLNVCQRKLGTIIIQTVRILQHESAVTDSLPEEECVLGHSNILPNDLARQQYRYTSVPIEAVRLQQDFTNFSQEGARCVTIECCSEFGYITFNSLRDTPILKVC